MDIFDPITFYYILTFAVSSVIIILGAMLLGIHIQSDDRLNSFRIARRYLSFSYFILGISGFIVFFLQQETENKSLLASCTLIIASYQALSFTYTILALIQPLYVRRKMIYIQLATITSIGLFLILALSFSPDIIYPIVFYITLAAYFLQILYYTYIFRLKYNICLSSLEEYYEDDERIRLQWVKFCFYSALAIGILALIALHLNLYFYILFSILYTIYYAYIVMRFCNYQIDFGFAISAINQDKETNKETTILNDIEYPTERNEQFKETLDKWVEEKKFALKDVSVDEIAKSLHVDRSYLQYYFRTHMPTDFRSWRSELRIREAQLILKENPEISLEKVRESVGFNHRANFHQQFQKITNATPKEFKIQCSNESEHK